MTAPDRVEYHEPRFTTVGEGGLCYDAFGDPEHPTMLLIMGLGFQLVHWPEDFCRLLAAEDFRILRSDNRDAGRSTHLPGRSYTLEDMADDAVGLLDALDVGSAHVVGASLGGMIGQTMAIRHPPPSDGRPRPRPSPARAWSSSPGWPRPPARGMSAPSPGGARSVSSPAPLDQPHHDPHEEDQGPPRRGSARPSL